MEKDAKILKVCFLGVYNKRGVTANAEIDATSCVYFLKMIVMRNELRI